LAVELQLLKVPATRTAVAFGAQTRKVVPAGSGEKYGIAPTPGREDCARAGIAETPTAPMMAQRA
jgi:hypothetical protein